eukprot:TRINITY_DN18174_c0_g1_i1.p1 TRINITY_DN18174_c0_g1~~TRINITY_DN18174_c0_g1_i1.p1  ORF type:complete len:174 (+),score=11.44 TRINITY_DN18174_c0_g1_i1:284-805(+)
MACARIHPSGTFTCLRYYKQHQVSSSSNQCSRPSLSLTGTVFQGVIQRLPARVGWRPLVSRVHRGSVKAVVISDPTSNAESSSNKNARSSELEVLESAIEERGTNGSLTKPVEELKKLLSVKDYMVQVQNLIRHDGGPPRWFCPINVAQYPEAAPLLLFIPGIWINSCGTRIY